LYIVEKSKEVAIFDRFYPIENLGTVFYKGKEITPVFTFTTNDLVIEVEKDSFKEFTFTFMKETPWEDGFMYLIDRESESKKVDWDMFTLNIEISDPLFSTYNGRLVITSDTIQVEK